MLTFGSLLRDRGLQAKHIGTQVPQMGLWIQLETCGTFAGAMLTALWIALAGRQDATNALRGVDPPPGEVHSNCS